MPQETPVIRTDEIGKKRVRLGGDNSLPVPTIVPADKPPTIADVAAVTGQNPAALEATVAAAAALESGEAAQVTALTSATGLDEKQAANLLAAAQAEEPKPERPIVSEVTTEVEELAAKGEITPQEANQLKIDLTAPEPPQAVTRAEAAEKDIVWTEITPREFSADVMNPSPDAADEIIAVYDHNRSLVNGQWGLVGREINRVDKEIKKIEKAGSNLAGHEKQFGRRKAKLLRDGVKKWLRRQEVDSVQVAEARGRLDSATKELHELLATRDAYFRQEHFRPQEIDQFTVMADIQNMLSRGGDQLTVMQRRRLLESGLARVITNTDDARAWLSTHGAESRWQEFCILEYGGGQIIFRDRRGRETPLIIESGRGRFDLTNARTEQAKALAEAQKKERAVTSGRTVYNEILTPMQKELLDYKRQLSEMAELLEKQYAPEREQLKTAMEGLQAAQIKADNVDKLIANPEYDGNTKKKQKEVDALRRDRIPQLQGELIDIAGVRQRLARIEQLRRGLDLADNPPADLTRLTAQDRFQYQLAQALLGRRVLVDQGIRATTTRGEAQQVASAPEPPQEPTPPKEPAPPAPPLPTPDGKLGEVPTPVTAAPTESPDQLIQQQAAYNEITGIMKIKSAGTLTLEKFETEKDVLQWLEKNAGWESDKATRQRIHAAFAERARRQEASQKATEPEVQKAQPAAPEAPKAEKSRVEKGSPQEDYQGTPIQKVEVNAAYALLNRLTKGDLTLLQNESEQEAAMRILMQEQGIDEARAREIFNTVWKVFEEAKHNKTSLKDHAKMIGALAMILGMNAESLLNEGIETGGRTGGPRG